MKIKLEKNQKVFFTSDTHYSHANICSATTKWDFSKGERTFREFESLEEMNKTLVDNINKVVGEDDILFHLGDWSFGGIDKIWEFRKQIKCKNIHLITGNHDHHIINDKILPNCHSKFVGDEEVLVDGKNPCIHGDSRDSLFDVAAKDLFKSVNRILDLCIQIPTPNNKKDKKLRFELCHFPICSWEDMNQGVIHLHGHVHLPKELRLHEGRAMDVGVDGNMLEPISLEEVLETMKDRPIKTISLKKDHHENL